MLDIYGKFLDGRLAVNCKTERKAKSFIKFCFKNGIKWNGGNDTETNYELYREETCYIRHRGNLMYGSKDFFKGIEDIGCEVVAFDEFMEEYLSMKEFTKDDLEVGMMVMFRNEWRRIVMPETMGDLYLMGCQESHNLDEYGDDLKCNFNKDYDIVAVYSLPIGYVTSEDIYMVEYRGLIWERDEPKKLTVKDIEELLGYKVEIVSSN